MYTRGSDKTGMVSNSSSQLTEAVCSQKCKSTNTDIPAAISHNLINSSMSLQGSDAAAESWNNIKTRNLIIMPHLPSPVSWTSQFLKS